VERLAAVAVAVAALIVGVNILQGLALGEVVRTGIAVAIAAVPEGLPAVVTIAMAVGVRRMARRRALVRRLPTVESLGSATVECTDKTGTLTTGEMTVTTLWIAGRELRVTGVDYGPEGTFTGHLPENVADDPDIVTALRIAALANRADVLRVGERWEARGDPTEAALRPPMPHGLLARARQRSVTSHHMLHDVSRSRVRHMNLPFTLDDLLGTFRRYNEAVGPILWLFYLLAVMVIIAAARPIQSGGRLTTTVLALIWL